jgi:hypothetical protein
MPDKDFDAKDLDARNRRLVRIILAIMAALVTASFLVGVRW